MRYEASEIAVLANGEVLSSPKTEHSICIGMTWDSRKVSRGDLYVALVGERVDGHSFVSSAIRSGASAVLVQANPTSEQLSVANEHCAAIIKVPSTYDALPLIAKGHRASSPACVIALTGSSGKTTTKGMIRQVLESFGSTIATEGNQNNELGVPATIMRIKNDTEYAVVEMGMRGLHQLEELCEFVQPDMALVTNVGTSHMELLGSRENIARAKAEPFASLRDGGVAFINSSDDYVNELRVFGATRRPGITEVFFDGSGNDPAEYPEGIKPEIFARNVAVDNQCCPSFEICLPGDTAICHLQMAGLHNVHNAMAAAAIGWKLGMTAAQIAMALQGATATAGRQQIHKTNSGITVIDDAYNANPDSMRVSLSMFASLKVEGRKFAVLGDMGELGEYTNEGHDVVGRHVADLQIDCLYCVGALSERIGIAAIDAGLPTDAVWHTMDANEALSRLKEELRAGDAVLVKASHSMALERIVEGLI